MSRLTKGTCVVRADGCVPCRQGLEEGGSGNRRIQRQQRETMGVARCQEGGRRSCLSLTKRGRNAENFTRPTIAFARTQTSTTNTCQSPVLRSSLLPPRSSSSVPSPPPSPRSVSFLFKRSLVLVLSTLVACSSQNSITRPRKRPRPFTPARPHGPTTTKFSQTSTFPSSHIRTSARRQRDSTSMACSRHSNLLPRVASSSFTRAPTTQLVLTPRKINGRRSRRS